MVEHYMLQLTNIVFDPFVYITNIHEGSHSSIIYLKTPVLTHIIIEHYHEH